MNLSEGDVVVTPEGDNYKVSKTWGISPSHIRGFPVDELIKTDSPLRVLLTEETDARYVIEHATKQGFDFSQYDLDPWLPDGLENIALWPDEKAITVNLLDNQVASTVSIDDTRQWKGWLDFHASEDECETCEGRGKAPDLESSFLGSMLSKETDLKPCPDCSEDDQQIYGGYDPDDLPGNVGPSNPDDQRWESPEPSDPAWREAFLEREKPDGDIASTRETGLALGIDSYSEAIADIFDYIDRLEDFSETMREWGILNRDGAKELKEKVKTLEAERDELRGRIREAKDYVTHTVGPGVNTLVKILDGEGDGSGE